MATIVDRLPINGMRKTHLKQLAYYIRKRNREGWYYGRRDQFNKRHKDLLEFAKLLETIVADNNIKISQKKTSNKLWKY